jgi:D-alanine-D-alanine ligase-like ATP-grasp enzyme
MILLLSFFSFILLFPPIIESSFFGGFCCPKVKGNDRWLSLLRAGEENADTSTTWNILFLMDSFCSYHGGYLAACAQDIPNTVVIQVLSDYLADYCQANDPDDAEKWESMRMHHWQERLQEFTATHNGAAERIAVYCESDSGLNDAEALRQQFALQGRNVLHDNPIESEARRNKFLMQKCLQETTSLPTVRQRLCHSLDEALEFWEMEGRVVVKPQRGVASESVRLCHSRQQVAQAWHDITSSAVFGARRQQHTTVVVQEWLQGTEYAVDVVSRNGQHKVAAVWRYDKRPANGAAFCYFQTKLVDAASDENVVAVCDYVKSTLNALGVRWGLSHNEVIVRSGNLQPMLVEVNCRQHNMDFAPLTMACIRYNAFQMLLDAYFGGDDKWDQYPELPTLQAHGCMVHLVNYARGSLVQVHHLEDMAALPSVLEFEVYEEFQTPSTWLEPTIDIRTDAGWVQLINEDPEALQHDYEQIVAWMPDMFLVSADDG